MSLLDSRTTEQPFRILSIDGGGIRGAFVAGFLAEIESRTGRCSGEHFDLIAGTSTGGIIAAGLAFRHSALRLEEFYREHGPLIFRRWWERPTRWYTTPLRWVSTRHAWFLDRTLLKRAEIDHYWLWRSKYGAEELTNALTQVFEERNLELSPTRLVIPSVNLTLGRTKVFKTPHLPKLHIDRKLPVTKVVLATAAAPTYFPHVEIEPGSAYIDGGVWSNNPSMVAIAESIKISQECKRPNIDPVFNLATTEVLSIGTGKSEMFADPPGSKAGLWWWASRLIDVISQTQSQGASFQAQYILADRFRRVDFDLPDRAWKLDSVELIEQMILRGRERGRELFGELGPRFFTAPAAPYTPFPEE